MYKCIRNDIEDEASHTIEETFGKHAPDRFHPPKKKKKQTHMHMYATVSVATMRW